jgi:hypothetical protein
VKKDRPKASEDPNRSVDQDVPMSKAPEPQAPLGPLAGGPGAGSMPAPGGPVLGGDTPSEGERALERELEQTRARPQR